MQNSMETLIWVSVDCLLVWAWLGAPWVVRLSPGRGHLVGHSGESGWFLPVRHLSGVPMGVDWGLSFWFPALPQ